MNQYIDPATGKPVSEPPHEGARPTDFDEPGLEDDGGVLDDDEPVGNPPAEDELRPHYEGERPPEPDKLDDDPDDERPANPDEPILDDADDAPE